MLSKVDVVIVGAGLVGSSLALKLGMSGLSVLLMDAATEAEVRRPVEIGDALSVDSFEARVSALTAKSQDLLNDVGAWSHLPHEMISAYQSMFVWDELGTGNIQFDAADIFSSSIGCIVENQRIVNGLHKAMDDCDKIQRRYGTTCKGFEQGTESGNYQVTTNQSDVFQCELLVAADGANSALRQQLGFETREWDYGHHAIVATVKTSHSHSQTAWQRFSERGPLAFLPLPDEHYCSIVWSQESAEAERLMNLEDVAFLSELFRASEGKLGELLEISQRYRFPLRQRHAKRYYQAGVVLIGDAAHTIHPLAGQGVNLGFKDVSVLGDVLLSAREHDVYLGEPRVLARYQRQRMGDNLAMMAVMESFKRIFGSTNPILRLARNHGLSWVGDQAFLKKQIIRQVMA